jgi:putative mRNA 3-end processing factor
VSHTPGVDDIDVHLSNGISIQAPGIGEIQADSSSPEDAITVLSHAHGDHLADSFDDTIAPVCSDLTAALAAERRGGADIVPGTHNRIRLLPAGHIAGARAAYIDSDAGSILYTGDITVRDRYYLNGFDPIPADVLIIEATYGKPEYVFPPVEDVEEEALAWLADNDDSPAILFGYPLGKAQKIQQIAVKSNRDRILTTDAVLRMNGLISDALDVEFSATEFDAEMELTSEDILVLPDGLSRLGWVESVVDEADAVTAGFSGWAHDDSYIYRRGGDAGFVLSDHCDFEELLEVVDEVNPEQVYTHHGAASELATALTHRGYDAQALRENQTSLEDF